MYTFYLTCPRGLENTAANEIKLLTNQDSRISNGGISFTGDKKDLYNINLQHRTGMVLLVELFTTPINTINDLYYRSSYYPGPYEYQQRKINAYNLGWNVLFNKDLANQIVKKQQDFFKQDDARGRFEPTTLTTNIKKQEF